MTLTHDTDTVPSGATRSAEGGPLSRRSFMGLVGAGTTALGVTGLGARMAFATPASPSSGDVIVVVFMRGAWDGLSVVAPYQMPTYKALRPTIRIKEPAEFTDPTGKAGLPLLDGGAVAPFPLSGTFAFNPSMTHLHQGAWADGHLAVVHAAGMPASESSTRSHFEAEQYWEKGTRSLNVTSGFLNRYLSGLSGLDRLSAVGRGSTLQTSLQGAANAVSMGSISGFGVTGFPNNTQARTALVGLYPHGPQLLEETGADTPDVVGLIAGMGADPGPQNGATYGTDDLSNNLREVARLIRADVGLRAVAIDYGGWDTHSTMGRPEDAGSYMRQRTGVVSQALQAFYTDLGAARDEVTLVKMSEFGRTIGENGSGGTDHGRGNVMFALGGKIRGGVYGDFPATIEDGPEGDLTVMTDYRRVVSEILEVRGGATNPTAIFPTYTPQAPLGLTIG